MNRSASRRAFILPLSLLVLCGAADCAWAAAASTATSLTVTSAGSAVSTVSSGTVITLTATVKSGSTAIKPGQVKFCDATATYCTDIHLIATAQLTSTGTATFKFVPGIGNHSYKAVFLGTTGDAASSSAASPLTVTGTTPAGPYPTTTTVTQGGTPAKPTLTATVVGYMPASGLPAPTGTVPFLDTTDGDEQIGSAILGAGSPGYGWLISQSPATGLHPNAMVEGDFNGDGLPDLAVLNFADSAHPSGTITILLGSGDGTFTPSPSSLATGNGPVAIAAGDFNGDGKIDLVVVNATDNAIGVLLGNGDGTFTAAAVSPATGNTPSVIKVSDFNRDGNADLAVLNDLDNTVTILLGNGDGTFTASTVSPATSASPQFLAVADFNADGNADLAIVCNSSSSNSELNILLGNGDGTFTAAANPTGTNFYAPVAADFNGDGKTDLAITDYVNNTVAILLGNGDGTFTRSASGPPTGAAPYSVAVLDYNGDGVADLAVANVADHTVTMLKGKGDGTFTSSATPFAGGYPEPVVTGDFNGDGRPDVAVANLSQGTATVLLTKFTQTSTATTSDILISGSGTHQVEASYPGGSNFNTSVSSTIGLNEDPQISLTATSLAFASQYINTQSPAQTVTLTSTGIVPVTISSIALSGVNVASYLISNNCGAQLAPGASCAIRVRLDPQTAGSLTATVTLADNATNSPPSIALSGAGTFPPALTLSATSVVFGNQDVNTESAPQTVTLTNKSATALTISSIKMAGANASSFLISNNCGSGLAAGAFCGITLRADPKVTGPLTAAFTITDNAPGSPQPVPVSGNGIYPPAVSLSATSVVFGNQQINTQSALQTVTLTNTGKGSLNISSTVLGGAHASQFRASNNCGASVAAGASCTLNFRFYPENTGTLTATYTLTDDAATSPQTVQLTGTGIYLPYIYLYPNHLAFGTQQVGVESDVQTVSLTNDGGQPLTFSTAFTGANGASFLTSNNCGTSVAVNASCTIRVRFDPKSAGAATAALTLTSNASNSPQSIALTGTGYLPPTATLSATSIAFGNQKVNTESAAHTITLSNTGSQPLNISSIALTGPHPGQYLTSNNCGSGLTGGASCTINLRFHPRIPGSLPATLTITDNAANSPQSITLTGTGQ